MIDWTEVRVKNHFGTVVFRKLCNRSSFNLGYMCESS